MRGGEESGTVTYLMAFRTWGGEMYNILSTSRPGHNTVNNFLFLFRGKHLTLFKQSLGSHLLIH